MNRRHLLAAALPLSLSVRAAAGEVLSGERPRLPTPPRALDGIAKSFIGSGRGMGLSVAAARDERLVFSAGYGIANIETSTPVTTDTVFRAGSITKQFTAVAIMKLVEKGHLGLDEPASKYIPEMVAAGPISIRMLLHQTSGLRNYSGSEFAQQQKIDRTTQQMLDHILAQKPLLNFKPNERF
ncbi:CubicO group peptidase (beta-lactamase class C family) [Sphingosinicella soli]|uniref:CubicO group peptidase (Beta-lactamase class C family) n=1 Tax=Sphingosinicella soli TaxID=333708 RepID=A0A7W7AYN1_9SPHN|nr:CubicO group peptidase (beta-lactamase class C family) [Sphingosinicella soli]